VEQVMPVKPADRWGYNSSRLIETIKVLIWLILIARGLLWNSSRRARSKAPRWKRDVSLLIMIMSFWFLVFELYYCLEYWNKLCLSPEPGATIFFVPTTVGRSIFKFLSVATDITSFCIPGDLSSSCRVRRRYVS
jgi:hypothetical protein